MKTSVNPEAVFFDLKPSFSHMPGLTLGATDSAHGVFFGRDGNRVVAVKPYEGLTALERAEHEQKMYEYVRCAGFLTLQPVKVEATRNGTIAYLLTDYVPNLTTMSAVVQRGNRWTPDLVNRTARTLGQLHAKGISHGDAQIKNFGIIPTANRQIAVIDLERSGNTATGHVRNDPFQEDANSLVSSLAHKTYGGLHAEQAADAILHDVIEPYAEVAGAGLGQARAEEIGLNALATHIEKHEALYPSSRYH